MKPERFNFCCDHSFLRMSALIELMLRTMSLATFSTVYSQLNSIFSKFVRNSSSICTAVMFEYLDSWNTASKA